MFFLKSRIYYRSGLSNLVNRLEINEIKGTVYTGKRPLSFIPTIFEAYRNFRMSYRIQSTKHISEARLLSLAFLGVIILFIARLPELIVLWHNNLLNDVIPSLVGISLFTSMFFAPLILYSLSAVIHIVAKLFKGKGTFKTSRLALFWSIVVSSPILLINGIVQGYFYETLLARFFDLLTMFFVLWIVSSIIVESEKFSSVLPLFSITVCFTLYFTFSS